MAKVSYKKFKIKSRITLVSDEKFFGRGVSELLRLIDKSSTMQEACKIMDMSYSKAWKIIKRVEKELGCKIITAKSGGIKGGTTVLTDEARDLINRFDSMEEDVAKYTDKAFKKYFL